jgi:hypothetical protein
MSTIGNTPGVSSQRFVQREVIAGSSKAAFVVTTGYSLGYVDVQLNGSQLDEGDFTAADGVNVILAQAAVIGDVVRIIAWLPRGLSDGYLKSEANGLFLRKAGEDGVTVTGGNLLVGTAGVGAPGLSVASDKNISFTEGSANSLVNIFRQSSSADAVLGSGVRYSPTSNGFASSYGAGGWARSAVSASYGAIKFFAASVATVAVGTDVTLPEVARIDSNGQFLFPNGSGIRPGSSQQFVVTSNGFYQQSGGSYYLVTTAGGSTSDATLKTNVQQLTGALAKVCAIRGVNFEFTEEPMCTADKGTQLGVIAQEVEAQYPEIVTTDEDGKKAVRYDRLVAPLIEAIKEQQAIITDQEVKMGQLVDQLTNAESTMNLLTEMFTESQQTVAALTARVEALEGTPQ